VLATMPASIRLAEVDSGSSFHSGTLSDPCQENPHQVGGLGDPCSFQVDPERRRSPRRVSIPGPLFGSETVAGAVAARGDARLHRRGGSRRTVVVPSTSQAGFFPVLPVGRRALVPTSFHNTTRVPARGVWPESAGRSTVGTDTPGSGPSAGRTARQFVPPPRDRALRWRSGTLRRAVRRLPRTSTVYLARHSVSAPASRSTTP